MIRRLDTTKPDLEKSEPEKPILPAEQARMVARYVGKDGLTRFAKKMRIAPKYTDLSSARAGTAAV